MHRRQVALCLSALLSAFSGRLVYAQTAIGSPQIVASGRLVPGPDPATGLVELPQTLSWSATVLTTRFYGQAVSLNLTRVTPALDMLTLQTLGVPLPLEIQVTSPAKNVTQICEVGNTPSSCLVTGLPLGNYTLQILKVSEPLSGEATLQAINLGQGGRWLPVELPPSMQTGRRMLFIGDSFTAGLGNLGNATCNPLLAVGALENSFLTYAGLTAQALNADAQLIAWSAAGVEVATNISLSGGLGDPTSGSSGQSFTLPVDPQLFRRGAAGDPASVYNFSSWVPQVVVFAGGVNDFAVPQALPDLETWVAGYLSFIQNVSAIYDQPNLILASLPFVKDLPNSGESSGEYQSRMSRLFSSIEAAGVPYASFLEFDASFADPSNWCEGHPDAETHEILGQQLTNFIKVTMPEVATGVFAPTVRLNSN